MSSSFSGSQGASGRSQGPGRLVLGPARRCAKTLVTVMHPVRSRVHGRFLKPRNSEHVDLDQWRIRTVFSLRLGHLRTENDKNISEDMVRAAFNSPFRPFLLTSTSTGQEGLDFYPWCHRLVHWNLPGNPPDLEQREGRVHWYKGHAVRRIVLLVQKCRRRLFLVLAGASGTGRRFCASGAGWNSKGSSTSPPPASEKLGKGRAQRRPCQA